MESDPLPESYTASMRINGVMCFYGSAVPQGTTETGVKLQLLSGNSEMNFFSDEVYIDELDLGKDERDIDWYYSGLGNFCLPLDDEPTDNNKFARTSDFYNDVEHVEGLYMPFRIKEREDWEAYAAKYGNYLEPSVAHKLLYYTYRVYWQPYLLHVIKRIIKSQGYEVRYNDLEDSFLKHVFICNYRETREFAKALPHWTVNKFFDELEKFCALVVVADSRERTVDLYSLTTFYSNDNKTEYIEDSLILSEYAAEYAGPNTEKDITTGNVGFELNYNDGYVQLDEEILNMAVHHDYGNFEEIKNALSGMKKEEAAGILFHDSSENRDYIRLEKGKDMGKPASFGMFVKEEDAMNVFLKEVNLYGDLIRDASNTDKTILNIVPATMTDSNLGFWWDTGGSLMHNDTSYLGGFNLFLPTVERLEAGTGTDGIKNIQAVIDGDETPERGNEDGANVYGMTLEGKLAWRNKWQLQAGFTLQNAEYKKARSWDDGGVAEEKRMFRTPDTYGYFTMIYTPIKPLNVALSGTYTGSMLVEHHSGYIETNRTEKTGKFMDMGLKVSYDFNLFKGTTLQLNAGLQNMFNSYQNDFDKGADRDSGYIYGPGMPRSFFAGVKLSY